MSLRMKRAQGRAKQAECGNLLTAIGDCFGQKRLAMTQNRDLLNLGLGVFCRLVFCFLSNLFFTLVQNHPTFRVQVRSKCSHRHDCTH